MGISIKNYYILNGQANLDEIKSIVDLFGLNRMLVQMIEDHEVNVGIYQNKEFIFEKDKSINKYLQELRLFDDDSELKFIRLDENKYCYRFISNNKFEKAKEIKYDIYEDFYLLNGSRVVKNSENKGVIFSSLTEDSGVYLTLPFKLDKGNINIFVNVINYISFNSQGLMEFVDSRLEGFYLNEIKLRVGE